jgi:hypothetical protein
MTAEDLLANFRLTILLWWGLANIALSVAALLVARGFWRGVFIVNLIWNVLRLSLGPLFSLYLRAQKALSKLMSRCFCCYAPSLAYN